MASSGHLYDLLNQIYAQHGKAVGIGASVLPQFNQLAPSLSSIQLSCISCANPSCQKISTKNCANCLLVKYCGKECQKVHWDIHKKSCKRHPASSSHWEPDWCEERRLPAFMRMKHLSSSMDKDDLKHLWGSLPAIDVFNLAQNEGSDYNNPLFACFSSSGDLRNLIQSTINLPENYNKPYGAFLNDEDHDIVIRNALILLIIYTFPSAEAATIATHIWYSAKLPRTVIDMIQAMVKPIIQRVCEKTDGYLQEQDHMEYWKCSGLGLIFEFSIHVWRKLLKLLDFDLDPVAAQAAREAAMRRSEMIDEKQRLWIGYTPHRRVADDHFVDTGILAPLAANIAEFQVPNSTLYDEHGRWHDSNGVYPYHGWHMPTVISKGTQAGIPPNDIYGALFNYVHGAIKRFHQAIRQRPTTISMSNVDAMELSTILQHIPRFDRIDVSNLLDQEGVGPHIVHVYRQFLKSKAENQHACIIGAFKKSTDNFYSAEADRDINEMRNASSRATASLSSLPVPLFAPMYHRNIVHKITVIAFLRTFELHTDSALEWLDSMARRISNLKIKQENTIVEKWPHRVCRQGPISREKIEEMCMSRLRGEELYVEWKHV